MTHYYADTSVLVKRHLPKVGAAWVSALAHPGAGNTILSAHLSLIELYSALNRRVREKSLPAADYARLVMAVEHVWSVEYMIIGFSPSVAAYAKRLLERHPLRAYDAVQLASAFIAQQTLPAVAPLVFLSADDRLLAAAQAEGFLTDNPNHHP